MLLIFFLLCIVSVSIFYSIVVTIYTIKETFDTPIKVIYTSKNHENDWEADYIKVDLCSGMEIEYIDLDKVISHVEEHPELKENHIFAFSSNEISYEDVVKIVDTIKPLVILHMSDEWAYDGNERYLNLADKTKLLMRQYNVKRYNIQPYPNIYHIPLGYMVKFLNGTPSTDRDDIRPVTDRKYNWSFIGNMKQDRQEMIDTFKKDLPNYYIEKTSADKMFEIYNDSVFVLNGRGNVSINCFRIYEAAVSGAIPVIVGDWDEIRETLNMGNHDNIVDYNNIPPFIYEKTWDDAVIRCKKLLDNPDMLQDMQKDILIWWNNIVNDMQHQIRKTIEEHRTI